MADFEARVKTKVGEISIHFNNKEDLEKKLQQVREFVDAINKTGLVTSETKVVSGLEKIYTLTADGLPHLLKLPKSKSDVVRLLLFVSQNSLSIQMITKLTGIKNPVAYMQGDHFLKLTDDTYTLQPEGRTHVVEKIIPKLLPKGEK